MVSVSVCVVGCAVFASFHYSSICVLVCYTGLRCVGMCTAQVVSGESKYEDDDDAEHIASPIPVSLAAESGDIADVAVDAVIVSLPASPRASTDTG